MFRKILTYIGWAILLGTLGCYFWFAGRLQRRNRDAEICKSVHVVLLDSARNRFVTKEEIFDIVSQYTEGIIGKKNCEIELTAIEQLLNKRSAVKESQVSLSRAGRMNIEITQRRPVLRIETENGGFYVDESRYIFPLVETFTSYVPVVTGNIPVQLNAQHRGLALEDEKDWIGQVLEMGLFLDRNPFWNAQIEQIYVEKNGDLLLCPRIGSQTILFGAPDNIEEKFRKLYAFYKTIVPEEGWERYSTVNLKYKNQIVCKLNKYKKP